MQLDKVICNLETSLVVKVDFVVQHINAHNAPFVYAGLFIMYLTSIFFCLLFTLHHLLFLF